MAIFKKKSKAEKARKSDKREVKKKARAKKKTTKSDARNNKQDARKDSRDLKKQANADARAAKKAARDTKKDKKKDLRESGLKGKDKRVVKKTIRGEKKDSKKLAKQDKKDKKTTIRKNKSDKIDDINSDKKKSIKAIRTEKRKTLKSLKVPKRTNRQWTSYLNFQVVNALEIYKPKTLDHLKTICRIATEEGLKVRAVGSGHSFSEIATTDDILVETSQMNKMLKIGAVRKRRFKQSRRNDAMVELEVGRTILNLSKELEKTKQAIGNQGTYDGQTFWGAVSTSTHGTGLSRVPLSDMVLSLVMVGEGGRTYRIEPKNGITNPDSWNEMGIDELIQDNAVFYSVICSFGSMGIVYSAVISVRPFYWFDEWTFITTWDTFKDTLSNDGDALFDFVKMWDNFSLLVSPVIAKKGKKDGVSFKGEYPCSFTIRRETDERRKIGGVGVDGLAKLLESVGVISGNAPAEGNPDNFMLTDLKRDDTWMSNFAVKSSGKRGWKGGEIALDDIPIKRRNKCYKIFPKGTNLFGGFALELAFPIRRTFEIMDRLIELAEDNKDDELYHTAPVAIRFVAPSKAYMSPQFGNGEFSDGTVMLELLIAKGTQGGKFALERIEDAMLHDPEVRVHWGLHMDRMNKDNFDFSEKYPRWNRFVATYEQFNQDDTFANDFTDRIGLSE